MNNMLEYIVRIIPSEEITSSLLYQFTPHTLEAQFLHHVTTSLPQQISL